MILLHAKGVKPLLKGGAHKRPPLYVAVHEAAHAVAMMFGQPPRWVDYITLRDCPDDAIGFVKADARFQIGQLSQGDGLSAEHRALLAKDAWQDIIDLMAGPITELRLNSP